MKFQRWTAGLTLTAFILSLQNPFGYALPDLKTAASKLISSAEIVALAVPARLGKTQETYQGVSPQTVIILQDAHSIPEAQKHLQGLIHFFQKKAGIELVALEGAEGDLDTRIFKSFPDQSRLRKVLRAYQKNGELSGGVMAALFSKSASVYKGIEDWTLYEQGITYYLDAQKNLDGIYSDLSDLAEDLARKKERVYPPELIRVDQAVEKFYTNHTYFEEALKILATVKRPENGSELSLILGEAERHDQNLKSFEAGIQLSAEAVLEAISELNDSARLAVFNRNYQDYQTSVASPEAFAAYLQTQAADLKVPLSFSEELLLQIDHQKKLDALAGTRLFRQFERYAQAVKTAMIQTDAQVLLNDATLRLRWLNKMARLEMTFEDWQSLRAAIEDEKAVWAVKEKNLLERMSAQQNFYKTAERRDGIFLKNIVELMSEHRNPAVIAVAGGFHAEGLMRLLRQKKISYVLVMPALTCVPENNPYREHMLGNVSWKSYFRVEDGKVNLYEAFVRAIRDQLLQVDDRSMKPGEMSSQNQLLQHPASDSQLLHEWRDQLIRDLVADGRVADLQKYAPLLDEVSSGAEDAALVQWKANIHRFVEGLRRLEARGALHEPGVQDLLKTSTSVSLVDGPALLTRRAFRAAQLNAESVGGRSGSSVERQDLLNGVETAQVRRYLSQVTLSRRSEMRVARREFLKSGALAALGFAFAPAIPEELQAQQPSGANLTLADQARASMSGLFSLMDKTTGLLVDKATIGPDDQILQVRDHIDFTKTSPTNIGLGIVATVIARDQRWMTKEDAAAKLTKMVSALEQMAHISGFWYNWYDLANLDERGIPKVAINQFVSSVDNANLTASLMVLQSAVTGTPLADRIQKLLDAQDWNFFYNPKMGLMSHGYDAAQKTYSEYGYGTFNTEARLLSFIGVLHGVDPKAWDWMSREVLSDRSGQIPVVASWGGSLFESLFADVFMGAPDPVAQNNRDMVRIHRNAADTFGYKIWGWSPAQGAKDLYEEAGVPEVGARDQGKGYLMGAVSPYSSLLAARYVDSKALSENLANMRALNPRVFSPKFGYRDAIDPRTGDVSQFLLGLDKGMEVAGFDLLLQAALNQSGTAQKYFWQYLKKKSLDRRAAELFQAEKQKFAEAHKKYKEKTMKFETLVSLIDKKKGSTKTGAWNNESRVTQKLALDLDKREEFVVEVDYDVAKAGSFGGTFHRQEPMANPAAVKATHVVVSVRGLGAQGSFRTTLKVELKRGGQVLQELNVEGITGKWQDFVFSLKEDIGKIDEAVTVFVNDPQGNNRGRLRIANIALAAEKKEGAAKKRSEVRRLAVSVSASTTRFVAALLHPRGVQSKMIQAAVMPGRISRIVRVYQALGADDFETAVIAQAEALSTWAFDEMLRSVSAAEKKMPSVVLGVALPESAVNQAPVIFWQGFAEAFHKGEVREMLRQGGRFDERVERDLASRGVIPRNVKLSQSHELQSETGQAKVPTAVFDYHGALNDMFMPLEIQDVRKVRLSPKAAQFLGFLLGRILKTQADLLRRQPALSVQPEKLKEALLAALWAQGFTGLELNQGLLPNSLSVSGATALLVMQNLMDRQIEAAA